MSIIYIIIFDLEFGVIVVDDKKIWHQNIKCDIKITSNFLLEIIPKLVLLSKML